MSCAMDSTTRGKYPTTRSKSSSTSDSRRARLRERVARVRTWVRGSSALVSSWLLTPPTGFVASCLVAPAAVNLPSPLASAPHPLPRSLPLSSGLCPLSANLLLVLYSWSTVSFASYSSPLLLAPPLNLAPMPRPPSRASRYFAAFRDIFATAKLLVGFE